MTVAFWAILRESYRYLLARKLFWITLGISLVVAALYGSLGFNSRGMTFWYGLAESPNPIIRRGTPESAQLATSIFSYWVVDKWLTWIAAILALISTTSIFPDSMQPGGIDLALSKPNSRFFLFFAKYCGGLLFVLLQVAVFCAVVFVLVGWQVGAWMPGIFWAVPIVVLVFSFIFSINVFFGVWTRSALAALLLTMLAWFGIHGVQEVDSGLKQNAERVPIKDATIYAIILRNIDPDAHSTWGPPFQALAAILPKTEATAELMGHLFKVESGRTLDQLITLMKTGGHRFADEGDDEEERIRKGPTPKVGTFREALQSLGSSLIFELAILVVAAWLFSRRDY